MANCSRSLAQTERVKTALSNCINGVYRPTAGHIMLNGQDLTNIQADKVALARVGRAFQHASYSRI